MIAVYLVLALTVSLGGLVSKDDAYARVGPNSRVGCLEDPTTEQRLLYLEFWLDEVYSAADGRKPVQDLARIDLYGRKPIEATPEELIARIDPLWEVYDELIELYEGEEFETDPGNAARLASLEEPGDSWLHWQGWADFI